MVIRPCYPVGGKEDIMDQDKHNDAVDEHWTAVCHHGHTLMFDESNPFEYLLGESVRSIPSALVPEPSTSEWEAAGFTIKEAAGPGQGNYARLEDRAKESKARNAKR
jgi:hypothetical protein